LKERRYFVAFKPFILPLPDKDLEISHPLKMLSVKNHKFLTFLGYIASLKIV